MQAHAHEAYPLAPKRLSWLRCACSRPQGARASLMQAWRLVWLCRAPHLIQALSSSVCSHSLNAVSKLLSMNLMHVHRCPLDHDFSGMPDGAQPGSHASDNDLPAFAGLPPPACHLWPVQAASRLNTYVWLCAAFQHGKLIVDFEEQLYVRVSTSSGVPCHAEAFCCKVCIWGFPRVWG